MKIEFIRKHRDKIIGAVEDVSDRVGHRFINRGIAKLVIETKAKKPYKRKYEDNKRGYIQD